MKSDFCPVNEFICLRLRQLRQARGLSLRRMAAATGIPPSTYADLEQGNSRLCVENLHQILALLASDIDAVWPGPVSSLSPDSAYFRQLQMFRISELCALSGARAAALFRIEDRKCSELLSFRLSRSRIARLSHLLEQGGELPAGLRLEREREGRRFLLFVQIEALPEDIFKLAGRYLKLWSAYFSA